MPLQLLHVQKIGAEPVNPGENIVFESVLNNSGTLSYNTTTGVFTIDTAGLYSISWWVATQNTEGTPGASLGIVSPSAVTVVSCSPLRTGEVGGFAALSVTTTPRTFTLTNTGSGTCWLSLAHPAKALLIVHNLSTLQNLVDGSGSQAARGVSAAFGYTMGQGSFAVGNLTRAEGQYAMAQGVQTSATGGGSHAEGGSTTASGVYSHAQGRSTTASGQSSHAEGEACQAIGLQSHAEGQGTQAIGPNSHAEGVSTQAGGDHSHAEGTLTITSGIASHAEGMGTNDGGLARVHIMGEYGTADQAASWFLANGIAPGAPGLAAKILGTGEAYIDGSWNGGGADYAEMFESQDGQAIEPGYFIALADGEKIRTARAGDTEILGVSAAAPAFLADAGELRWKGKYLTDEWGRTLMHEVAVPALLSDDGQIIHAAYTKHAPMLNPDWDASRPYLPRRRRPEWVPVGMLGKLMVRDDGTCRVNGTCRPNNQGIATDARDGYRVLSRTGPNRIRILMR